MTQTPSASASGPRGPSVRVEGLRATYRRGFTMQRVEALRGIDLAVDPGEIVGILGPNGSGKSTLFRILAGDLEPTAGSVAVLGRPPRDPENALEVGYQPEGALPFPHLGARDHLGYVGALAGVPASELGDRVARWIERFGLGHAGRRPVKTFSTGMRRRVALAGALLADPRLLLLDEPTAGLDPEGTAIVLEELDRRARAGTAVVLASHQLLEVEDSCSRIVLLQDGRVRGEGTIEELLGRGSEVLEVDGLTAALRERLLETAQQGGARSARWTQQRTRHLSSVFRELTAGRDPAGGGLGPGTS